MWEDKWVPNSSTYKVVSPRISAFSNLHISELIDTTNICWKIDLLDQVFLPFEAEGIKSIPLSSRLPADKLIWAASPNGFFNVNSAYKVALELEKSSYLGLSSDDSNLRRVWTRIWKIQVPHKVRHFVWRACRDILPTNYNLKSRKILTEDVCAECNLDSKTIGHVFWSYLRAQRIWTCSGLFQFGFNRLFHTFMDLLWKLMMVDDWDQDHIELLVIVA